jgi:hypothetical protein
MGPIAVEAKVSSRSRMVTSSIGKLLSMSLIEDGVITHI